MPVGRDKMGDRHKEQYTQKSIKVLGFIPTDPKKREIKISTDVKHEVV